MSPLGTGEPDEPGGEGLTPPELRRVIAACDRFEDAWRTGVRPVIEDDLGETRGAERATLLHRLIAIEVTHRRRLGEGIRLVDYLVRFPDHPSVVRSAMAGLTSWEEGDLDPEGFSSTEEIFEPPPELRLDRFDITADRAEADDHERTDSQPGGPPPPMPARISRYRVIRLLGEGGFGRVYQAWDDELGRNVAVKVPRAGAFVTPRHAQAFVREARLAAGLKHHAIVTVHDIGQDADGSLFVVFEYIEGQSLSDLLRSEVVSHRRLAELLAQVAEALHYAHSRGLVHRDLKPPNLIIDIHGRPHVTDFGLAVHEEGVRALGRQIAGTAHYMAPEQVRGETHRLDSRTDVWGLGVVLYQMLTGRLPFQGRERSHVFVEVVDRDPIAPRGIDPSLPAELERICLKCLSKRMSDRYPTALELATDLWFWVAQVGKSTTTAPGETPIGGVSDSNALSATTVDTESIALRPTSRVIPKGLRSFDAADEGFFLALLAGPFDRDGLPVSLRIWKTRIESADPEEAFPVGLLFGPSGSGKSSLIKAGLLPHLTPHIRPVYLEASADGTDVRLLRGLRRACPGLPDGLSTAEALQVVREDPSLRRGKKILLVIDQFEQWLQAHRSDRGDRLVEALRQCDGVAVQCLLMARDDFGTAALRFMNALEVPLVEGRNCALVDLFDPLHARNVLTLYGRALGRLPAVEPLSADQRRFLDRAVAGMTREGKVAPVRLALFVEIFRGKTWEVASLRRVGGELGIGVLFLDEALGPMASNPRHRDHRAAALAVLSALLPAPGVNIKGHMKSDTDLLLISGYDDRPDLFLDLIDLLEGELRLIRPCDPERGDSETSKLTGSAPRDPEQAVASRSFQLTHDYLVPSLRKWLSQPREGTASGRAELLLEDRAAVWSGRPERRYLPTLLESARIALTTRRHDWTTEESRMMRSALYHHATLLALVALISAALAASGIRISVRIDRASSHGPGSRLTSGPESLLDQGSPRLDSGTLSTRPTTDDH